MTTLPDLVDNLIRAVHEAAGDGPSGRGLPPKIFEAIRALEAAEPLIEQGIGRAVFALKAAEMRDKVRARHCGGKVVVVEQDIGVEPHLKSLVSATWLQLAVIEIDDKAVPLPPEVIAPVADPMTAHGGSREPSVPADVRAALQTRAEIAVYLKTRASRLSKDGKPDAKGWIDGGVRAVNFVCCQVADEILAGEACGALLQPSLPDFLRPGAIIDGGFIWDTVILCNEVREFLCETTIPIDKVKGSDELKERAAALKYRAHGIAYSAKPRVELLKRFAEPSDAR